MTQMNFKFTILSKRSYTPKLTFCMVPFACYSVKRKPIGKVDADSGRERGSLQSNRKEFEGMMDTLHIDHGGGGLTVHCHNSHNSSLKG
jgi:hypothetical protein